MSYKVYIHTNNFNNKKYIGITSNKVDIRWGINGEGYKCQSKFYNAIKKYGWDNFTHEIIKIFNSKEEALRYESFLIKKYNTVENGYNISYYGNIDSKKVICLTTNEIFNSINEASEKYNISCSNLSHHLSGDYDTCGEKEGIKLIWEFLEDKDSNIKAQEKRLLRKNKRENKFYTKEALEIVNRYKNGDSLKKISKDFNKSKETLKLILTFHDIKILSSKERISHPVYMLDNNKNIIKEFKSLTEAAKYIGINENNIGRIKKACNEDWRKVKGYYWKWKV